MHAFILETAEVLAKRPKEESEGGSWFVLVDGSQFAQLPDVLKEGPNCKYLFEGLQEYEHLEGAGPWLLKTGSWEHTAQALDFWLAREVPAVSWILSALSFGDLAAHLIRQLKAKLPDDKVMTLRFYDARVMWAAVCAFTPEQNKRMLGGVNWWFLAPEGALLHRAGEGLPPDRDDKPYVFSAAQQDKVAQLLLPFTVLGEIRQARGEMVALYSYKEQLEGVKGLIKAAQSLGLKQINDFVAFAVLGCDFDLKFYEHPAIAEKLQGVKAGRDWAELLGEVPEQVWQELSDKNSARKGKLAI